MNNKEVEQHHTKMQKSFNKFLSENNHPINEFKFVAVGYLDISEPFEKGIVSANFLNKLRILWSEGPTLMTLGIHTCELCTGKDKATSSSEKILTDRENNIKYIFPQMIFHYIEEHNFKPSNEFIEFVMREY